MTDLRTIFRNLTKHRGYSALVILTLALGIGATTAVYSVIDSVLLNPIPGPHANRLVSVKQRHVEHGYATGLGVPLLDELEKHPDLFESVAASAHSGGSVRDGEFARRVWGHRVTPNYFQTLGIEPMLGRAFQADETGSAEGYSVVISHHWWQQQFNGDAGVIGTSFQFLDDPASYNIVGVMPPGFQYPRGEKDYGFWQAASIHQGSVDGLSPHENRQWSVVALRRVGASQAQTEAAVQSIYQSAADENADAYKSWMVEAQTLRQAFIESAPHAKKIYFSLLGATALILLIGVANAAILMMIKADGRRQEMAVRMTMGASRGRLTRQLLFESLTLSVVAGALGLLVAHWGINLLQTLLQPWTPSLQEFGVNLPVFGFGLGLSVVTGIAFGLVPAWRASGFQLGEALKTSAKGAASRAPRQAFSKSLIAAEVALTLTLTVGAGLMLASIKKMLTADSGFDQNQLVQVQINVTRNLMKDPESKYSGMAQLNQLYRDLGERFQQLPGTQNVGWTMTGFGSFCATREMSDPILVGEAPCSGGEFDYFRTLKVNLLKGRLLDSSDSERRAKTVVINQSLAQKLWPGQDPIGRQLGLVEPGGESEYSGWREVVGLVADFQIDNFPYGASPMMYYPIERMQPSQATFYVRSSAPMETLAPALREAVTGTARWFSVPKIETLESLTLERIRAQHTCMQLLNLFAAVGVALTLIGIYSVTAYAVTQRTQEIGIRMALGAQKRALIRLVVSQSSGVVLAGLFLGLLLSLAATRVLSSMLFEVSPTNPFVLAGGVGLLIGAAIFASFVPARRAVRLQPSVALRHE